MRPPESPKRPGLNTQKALFSQEAFKYVELQIICKKMDGERKGWGSNRGIACDPWKLAQRAISFDISKSFWFDSVLYLDKYHRDGGKTFYRISGQRSCCFTRKQFASLTIARPYILTNSIISMLRNWQIKHHARGASEVKFDHIFGLPAQPSHVNKSGIPFLTYFSHHGSIHWSRHQLS
jgi:hypothetical protein